MNNALVRFKNMLVEMQLEQNDIVGAVTVTNETSGDSITVELPDCGGGDTGGLEHLTAVTVDNENNAQVDIDPEWFDVYDYVLVVPDLVFSATDWLYMTVNNTEYHSSSPYTAKKEASQNVDYAILHKYGTDIQGVWFHREAAGPASFRSAQYLFFHMYSTNTKMTGKFDLYGGNFNGIV